MYNDSEHLQQVQEIKKLMGGVEVDDIDHAMHVAQLSDQLFRETLALHGFGEYELHILERAALLHDSGVQYGIRGHHKTALRIIQKLRLEGMEQRDNNIIACVARYHRKSLPKKTHAIYKDLSASDRRKIDILGGLLRLADAFDYEHDSGVDRLTCLISASPDGKHSIMVTAEHHITHKDSLEHILHATHEKDKLFKQAFQCRVSFSFMYVPHAVLYEVPASVLYHQENLPAEKQW